MSCSTLRPCRRSTRQRSERAHSTSVIHHRTGYKNTEEVTGEPVCTEVLGLHPNADITYQTNLANETLSTIISIQPKDGRARGGETREASVQGQANEMLEKLPPNYVPHESKVSCRRWGLFSQLTSSCDRKWTACSESSAAYGARSLTSNWTSMVPSSCPRTCAMPSTACLTHTSLACGCGSAGHQPRWASGSPSCWRGISSSVAGLALGSSTSSGSLVS